MITPERPSRQHRGGAGLRAAWAPPGPSASPHVAGICRLFVPFFALRRRCGDNFAV